MCRGGTAPCCSAGPLSRLVLLAEGDDLRALDDRRDADPEDGRGDSLRDRLERELVVAIHLEAPIAPGGVDEPERLAVVQAQLDGQLDRGCVPVDALELVVKALALAALGSGHVEPELEARGVELR